MAYKPTNVIKWNHKKYSIILKKWMKKKQRTARKIENQQQDGIFKQ